MKKSNHLKRLKGLRQRTISSFDRQDKILCEYDSCGECIVQKSCGWCASTNTCMQGRPDGPYGNETNCSYWNFALCEGGCKESLDCDACVKQPGCGFCLSTCECQQGHEKGPAFNHTCQDGWYHAESKTNKKCIAPQKWPGRWPRGTPYNTKICAAKQWRRKQMETMAPSIDEKNAMDVAKIMEDDDKVLFP